jgi:hypothetical protein
MEFLLPGDFWAALTGFYSPLNRDARTTASELDLSLIRLTYEFIAGQTACARCAHPLGRRVQVQAWPGTARSSWQVRVSVHCGNWRGHRHTAIVTEVSGSLRFGSLRPAH